MSDLPTAQRLELPTLAGAARPESESAASRLGKWAVPVILGAAVLCFAIGSYLPGRGSDAPVATMPGVAASEEKIETSIVVEEPVAPAVEIRKAIVIKQAIPVETLDRSEVATSGSTGVIELVAIED